MAIGDLLSKSWKEYNTNFKTISGLVMVFVFLPLMITLLMGSALFFSSGILDDFKALEAIYPAAFADQTDTSQLSPEVEQALGEMTLQIAGKLLVVLIPVFILLIIASFLSLFAYIGIFAPLFKKQKFSFSDGWKEAKTYYWRFTGLILLLMVIFLAAYLVLVIIGTILLSVLGAVIGDGVAYMILTFVGFFIICLALLYLYLHFSFSSFVLVNENKGVGYSISESWRIAHSNIWKIIGYAVILIIICIILGIIMSLISSLFGYIFGFGTGQPTIDQISGPYIVFQLIVNLIYQSIYYFVLIPVAILFFKNMYLDFKVHKRKR